MAVRINAGETGYGKSRYNSMVDGLRARLIFPDAMSWSIDNRALDDRLPASASYQAGRLVDQRNGAGDRPDRSLF